MSLLAPDRTHQSYRHEAFVWRERRDYLDGLVPFVSGGLAAGEAVMAALTPEHLDWMRDSLGAQAAKVCFLDITELGRNPARIIPAWREFVDDWSGPGRPARGIGEPIWPGRHPEELREAQLHEALLNLAVDPETPFWLVCPYHDQLGSAVEQEAHRSHPAIATADSYHGSPDYGGHAHAQTLFTADLPGIDTDPTRWVGDVGDIEDIFTFITLQAAASTLPSDKIVTLAEAVRRLARSSQRRGADNLTVRVWDQPDVLICEMVDTLRIDDYLIGRRVPPLGQDEPFWRAHQTCDLVQLRSTTAGTTIRLHQRK